MVLPIFKLFSFAIKTFSRPLIQYTKNYHRESGKLEASLYLRKAFMKLGYLDDRFQGWIDRLFLNLKTSFGREQISQEAAVEKGIQLFYQILFYIIIIGLAVYETDKSSQQWRQKQSILKKRIKNITQQTQILRQQIKKESEVKLKETIADYRLGEMVWSRKIQLGIFI